MGCYRPRFRRVIFGLMKLTVVPARLVPFSYEVMEPNCKGKFAVRYSTRLSDNFAKLPPTSLIQDYFKCRYGTSDIITNSFSNAFANSSAVAAGWLPLLVALIVFYLKKR